MLRARKHERSPSHVRARKQEKETAKRLGGKPQVASGASYRKGDVRIEGITVIECKTTSAESFRVTRQMMRKVEEEAVGNGEVPAIEVEFCDEQGRRLDSYYVMPRWAFEALLSKATK